MTKTKLKKEADDWVKANTKVESCPPWGDVKITPSSNQGYIAGAESREKIIKEQSKMIKALTRELNVVNKIKDDALERIEKLESRDYLDKWI